MKSFLDKVWSFFSSIKLAIVIFALVALTSIVGTVIEQQASYAENLRVLSSLVGQGLAPAAYKVLYALGFMNMYRSWWFLTLLSLFALNLLVCSIDRFPAIWRIMRTPVKPIAPDQMKRMPLKDEFVVPGGPDSALEKAVSAMKSIGFTAKSEKGPDGSVQLYAQKNAWSRSGVYVTHVSILVILLGAVLGVFLGFRGYVDLPEGFNANIVYSNNMDMSDPSQVARRASLLGALYSGNGDLQTAAQSLNESLPDFEKDLRSVGVIPLGFQVLCQQFQVQFYGQTDMPKAYRSLVTVLENGKPVVSKWIEVNHPLKYKGVMFYQSSFRLRHDLSNGVAVLGIRSPDGQTETRKLKIGQSFSIPGTKETVKLTEFNPALAFDDAGRAETYSQMMTNPAVKVDISGPDGARSSKWIVQRYPETWSLPDGSSVGLTDFWGVQATGLQVRKDPGVWVVYLGCILLALGLYVAFFISHKKIWVRMAPDKKGTLLTVAATCPKNRHAYEREIEKLVKHLKGGNQI